MQTLLFHKFIETPKTSTFITYDGMENRITSIPAQNPFKISRQYLNESSKTFKFKLILEYDYSRCFICVSTETYPLIWMFWWLFYQLEVLNYKLQSTVFYVLKDWFNSGNDFVPRYELVGHWNSMIKHFINYKLQKKCTQQK